MMRESLIVCFTGYIPVPRGVSSRLENGILGNFPPGIGQVTEIPTLQALPDSGWPVIHSE
jgi:hypothetical protein